jgi:hypothetical protein
VETYIHSTGSHFNFLIKGQLPASPFNIDIKKSCFYVHRKNVQHLNSQDY